MEPYEEWQHSSFYFIKFVLGPMINLHKFWRLAKKWNPEFCQRTHAPMQVYLVLKFKTPHLWPSFKVGVY